MPPLPVGAGFSILASYALATTSRRSRWTYTMANVPDFAGVLCEGEFADLLRKLPFVGGVARQRCHQCGAYLRRGNSRRRLCDPCRERHWTKAMIREGFPDHRITETVVRLFWAKVLRNGKRGCWYWTGYSEKGYPRISMDGTIISATRVSYELHYGPIPFRFIVVRNCGELRCVNPVHLEAIKRNQVRVGQ